ncbi:MAG TPA: L-threonylcarbamoyladenylate synthase [Smithellaceae bacterium]|nr:L-threonylcarbamoyladenylate synthase [Smithellaceae bacterium]HRS89900.1 L-threonylcarbamoyladenylate synthase [Smithellaceae bacterium]HRV26701.1 L-threonylcarbamoyladenylate synthase [Smithellaceae bacterium]
MTNVWKLSPEQSEEIISRAAALISRGGVIAYPTETFYGLGADATNEQALSRIFDIKGRAFHNPISVIISAQDDIYPLIKNSTDLADKLMKSFWPGPLTIVFNAAENVSALLTAGSGKIGIRLPGHPLPRLIAEKSGRPLTATSANLSGQPECVTADKVIEQIGVKIDAVIDGGVTPGEKASTIIDITCHPPAVLREGVITKKSLAKIIG